MRNIIEENSAIDKHYSILAGKFRRYHGVGLWQHLIDIRTNIKNARDLVYFIVGIFQSLAIFIKNRPDILFVKGGFVGLPVGLAAALLKIPLITHDSDSIPGLTNRTLSKYAILQAVGMPIEFYKGVYKTNKLRYSGIPVRHDFIDNNVSKDQARHIYNLKPSDKVLAVVGGSLGAIRLNQFVFENIGNLKDYKLLWITGSNSYEAYRRKIINQNVQLFSFTNDLANIIRSADVVVSRAGATTIAELALLAKPTILVPNPILAGGHQTINAEKLAINKAAMVLSEDELQKQPFLLSETVDKLVEDQKMSKELSDNISRMAIADSSTRITNVIYEVLKK